MRHLFFRLSAGLAVCLSLGPLLRSEDSDLSRLAPVADGQQIPVADFLRPAIFDHPRLNSSGTHIAAIITVGNDRHLLTVYNLKTKEQQAVGGQGDSDVFDINWLDDKRVIFQLSTEKLYGMGLFAANVDDFNNPYPLMQFYGTTLISIPSADRLRPIVWNQYNQVDNGRDMGVVSVNTDIQSTGKTVNMNALLAGTLESLSAARDAESNNQRHTVDKYPTPPGIRTGYMADKDGKLAFAFATYGKWHSVWRLEGDQWVDCKINTEKWNVYGPGNKPNELVVAEAIYNESPHPLRFMDALTATPGDVILQSKTYDFSGWLYRDPVTQEILGAHEDREGPHMVWFSDTYQTLQKILDGFFPGSVVQILGSNDAQNLFLVGTYSDREPIVYHWVDLATKTAGLIKHSRPWIDPKRMRPMGIFNFKTRDGHNLTGYLTLPEGASKSHPAPLVVLSHGGPYLRDFWGYNGEVQLLASRGYAVLQTNYRGSTGNDWMFPAREKNSFLHMHYDVADATRAVIAAGFVDPSRIAIMGGSFGGFLALEGVVDDPTLYRCAVGISGVYDWEDIMSQRHSDLVHFGSLAYEAMLERLGDPATNKEKFDAIAPSRHVDKIRVPVFVSHGGNDDIVDIGQARKLERELDKYHVPYESDLVSSEVHGMAHLANNVDLYNRILAFLDKNTAPAPAAVH